MASYPRCAAAVAYPQCAAPVPDVPIVPSWTQAVAAMSNATLPTVAPAAGSGTTWAPSTELCSCGLGRWALTYNVDSNGIDEALLTELANAQATATFFVPGALVVGNPTIATALRNAASVGHQVGLTSYTGAMLSTKTTDEIVSDMVFGALAIVSATQAVPLYFRPSQQDVDDRVRYVAAALGLTVVMYNFDADDDAAGSIDQVFSAGFQTLANGSTLNFPPTTVALPNGSTGYDGFISISRSASGTAVVDATTAILDKLASTTYEFSDATSSNFNASSVAVCDPANPSAITIVPTNDPFVNLINYWKVLLPVLDSDLLNTTAMPTNFSQPVQPQPRMRTPASGLVSSAAPSATDGIKTQSGVPTLSSSSSSTSTDQTSLAIGLGVGLTVLVLVAIALAAVIVIIRRKRQPSKSVEAAKEQHNRAVAELTAGSGPIIAQGRPSGGGAVDSPPKPFGTGNRSIWDNPYDDKEDERDKAAASFVAVTEEEEVKVETQLPPTPASGYLISVSAPPGADAQRA